MAEPKFEVVISGVGGLFPECNNVDELKKLLFDKVNSVTSDNRRWVSGTFGTPHAVGKIQCPEHFDNIFFGIHRKMAESLDILTRLSLERSVEAIFDAGINPIDLSGSNTAVFMNSCISESEFFEVFGSQTKGFGLLGHNRAMQANRLSYTLNLNGPSYSTDATWIGGAQALMRAKQMIEDGSINAAIIGSCNLCLNACISLQMEGLGILNNSTETRSFSADANGINRSESCVAILLQKSTEAKRSYGTLLNVTSTFGESDSHLLHCSKDLYREVLLNAYKEAGVDPAKVAYVEGEGIGIKNIDAMELNTLSDVFCTPNRIGPLKIGSVKSNVGHCEAASSLVSLVKALIILDSGYIPPNINYSEPNPDCPALISGNLEVVTEKTALKGDIVGISTFGLCNSFSHVILKQNKKLKTKSYEKGEMFKDGLPRIILVSGRNEEGVIQLKKRIKNRPMDEEFAALLHSVFYKSLNAHYYRSYFILPNINEETQEEISYLPAIIKRPIWFIFSGMGSQWNGMGKQLLSIPIFAKAIHKCDAVLKQKGVDLMEILTSEDTKLFDNILNSFVGIAAIQIGLVDVLKSIDITPDGVIGHSVGELGCAYADGCFTAEQMILAAHARGRASIETELIDGMMAAIGLGYNDVKDRLPHDVEVACHNALDSSTLSGPTESVKSFVEQLKSEGIFAKAVNVSNIAYHSQYIKPAAPILLKYLKEVIPEPKPRSSKWLSSSIPESEWGSELAQNSSPEYHTNNLLGQVLFEETSRHIPKDAIVIEIAPHGLLQAILKRSLSENVTNIPLTQRGNKDSLTFLLNAFGKMYNSGMTPNIEALYPPINYPVSQGTQALHSLFPWDHTETWLLRSLSEAALRVTGEKRFKICFNNEHDLANHKINGRHILPHSVFLVYVWKSFVTIYKELNFDGIIVFEELNFMKNIEIIQNDELEFYSLIQCGSGNFEVCLDDEMILKGKICRPDAIDMNQINTKMKYPITVSDVPYSSISKHDLYTLLEHNGYELGNEFKTVTNIDLHFEEYRGNVKWNNDWISFLNGVFTFFIYKSMESYDSLSFISSIRRICIDPSQLRNSIGKDISIYYNLKTNEIIGDGIYIFQPETKLFSFNALSPCDIKFEEERFINLINPNFKSEIHFINTCMQIMLESKKYQLNLNTKNLDIYYDNDSKIICHYVTFLKQILERQKIIQYITMSLDCANSQNLNSKNYNFVIVSKNQIQNVISNFKNVKKSHVLVISDEPLVSNKEWSVIMQQKIIDNYFVFMTKIIEKKIISLQIKNTKDLQSVHDDIKMCLLECKKMKSYLCIFTKLMSHVNLTRFIDNILFRNKSKKIRFIFHLDKSDIKFDVANTFYTEQLNKNILVNIYKDGEWGTFFKDILENISFNASIDNCSTSHINSIILDGLKVKYLGINFQDITVNKSIDNELGHLEYSGVTTDGKMIMGIAPFDKNTSKKISPDPCLSWIIPSNWSLEDAATVPLSYSVAYYIFSVLSPSNEYLIENTILVHAGFNAVGQAVISIALARGITVYTSVENEEQSKFLRNKFPSLPESMIFSYKKKNFEIELIMATKGKGISLIINCLSGEDFHATLRIIASFGKFFQLSKTDMKNKDKLGMYIFLNAIEFYSVSPDALLATSNNIKLIVQNEVQKGIELGIVKPFDRHVLTGPCTGEQAIKALTLESQGIESKRVILSLEGEKLLEKSLKESGYEKYQCNSNRVYLVVGSKSSTWIDLAEWLVVRGARKIVVAIKKYAMTTTALRRFNLLMTRYQNIMMQILSDSNLNSKEDLIQLFKDTTATTPLGGIFFVTLNDENDKIRNIQYALENLSSLRNSKPLFVCIMSGGEDICMELRANGVCPNAINISWSSITMEPKFSKLITSLDNILININTISSSSIVCTEYNNNSIDNRKIYAKMASELPGSIHELKVFEETVTEEFEFQEVVTNSLRFADIPAAVPIFVITGFQPEKMKKLYENLIYPTFEARLPEKIDSIENAATQLVQKIKTITNCGNVSLVGVSWGGVVAILMAQILEAENIPVSLTLVEGIPYVIQEWTKSLIQYGSINAKLVLNYFQINNRIVKELASKNGWNTELPKVLLSNNVVEVDTTLKALNAIRFRLNAVGNLKPLPNKIVKKITVISRSSNFEKSTIFTLLDYCINLPGIHILDEKDYNEMLSGKKLAQIINNNILHYYQNTTSVSINHYYSRLDLDTAGIIVF